MTAEHTIRARPPLATTILILICFLSLTYAWKNFRNTNEYSRIFLTRALIEHQTFSIDRLLQIHDTQDKSYFRGHYYSNKAPGSSFLAAPAYLAVRLTEIFGHLSIPDAMKLYLATSLTISIPSALFLLLLFKFWGTITLQGPIRRAVLIAYGLGTMVWPYSTMYYGHIPAAICLGLAFLIVFSSRNMLSGHRPLLEAGFFCGLAFAIEYPTALISACIFLYAAASGKKLRAGLYILGAGLLIVLLWPRLGEIEAAVGPHIESLIEPGKAVLIAAVLSTALIGLSAVSRGPGLLYFFLGAIPTVGLTLYYHAQCFGGPLQFPYYHETYEAFAVAHQRGIAGVAIPADLGELVGYLDRLWRLLISPFRGLFFSSPFLLLGISGMFRMCRNPDWRREGRFFVAATGVYLLFLAGFSDWEGGWSMGPRHLVPLLPFLATGVVYELAASGPRRRLIPGALLAVLGLLSIALTFIGTVTFPYFPKEFLNPFYELGRRLLGEGRLAPTLGEWFGLRGPLRLLPLLVPAGALAAIFLRDAVRFAVRGAALRILLAAGVILATGILLLAGELAGRRRVRGLTFEKKMLQEAQMGQVYYFMERAGERAEPVIEKQ